MDSEGIFLGPIVFELGVVHILRRQIGGREVIARSLRLSTRGREGYFKCLRRFL